jgi:hypothetical protein
LPVGFLALVLNGAKPKGAGGWRFPKRKAQAQRIAIELQLKGSDRTTKTRWIDCDL